MEHSATQVLERNVKPVCSGGQIIQGTLLVQGPLDHCMLTVGQVLGDDNAVHALSEDFRRSLGEQPVTAGQWMNSSSPD